MMKELYGKAYNYIDGKAYNYIVSNQSVIDLIESETIQFEKEIQAMWVAGYLQRELEKYVGKEKTYGYKGYDLDRIARYGLSVTKSVSWNTSRELEDALLNAYKAGYNTRDSELL